MSKPAESRANPPGAQLSGAAVNSSTNAAGRPGGGTQGFGAYYMTLPGKLKIGSVVLGLLAMSFTAYAYNNAWWFHPAFAEECRTGYGCVRQYSRYTYEEHCNKRNRGDDCPSSWLVSPQMYIIAFAWVGTLIMLIVLIFIDLSKNPTFAKVDMIGHLVAGGLVIVSGLCLLGFCASVWIQGGKCKDKTDSRRRTFQENMSNTTANGRKGVEDLICEDSATYFKQWHILVGAIFALATGVLYVMIGIMSLKSRRGQQVRPMMTG